MDEKMPRDPPARSEAPRGASIDAAENETQRIGRESRRDRSERQEQVAAWCAAAFGRDHARSVRQRGVRLLEEAIEAYQSAGGDAEMAHLMLDYVFARPPGNLHQELGGVGVTVLALAHAAGLSAENAERSEIDRVLSKPLKFFAERNAAKNAAGFDALAYPTDAEAASPPSSVTDDVARGLPPEPEGSAERAATPSSSRSPEAEAINYAQLLFDVERQLLVGDRAQAEQEIRDVFATHMDAGP